MSCNECRRTGRTPCKLNSTLLLTETYKLDKVPMGETEHAWAGGGLRGKAT